MTETELASLEALAKAKAVAWTNQFALDVTSLRGADVPYEQPMWSEPSPDHSIPLFSSAAILSLIEENKRMREAAIDALASLVAAHSLLKSGGKKAAPSDTMFRMMLDDYQKCIDRTRAALEPQS